MPCWDLVLLRKRGVTVDVAARAAGYVKSVHNAPDKHTKPGYARGSWLNATVNSKPIFDRHGCHTVGEMVCNPSP